MEVFLVILSALAPVAVLLFYIFRKDSAQPEPAKWLLKAFFFGVLSVFLSLCFSLLTEFLLGLGNTEEACSSIGGAFLHSFTQAAIPEELAKLIMLWLLLRKNPYFDEQFDGIVYAVCVGMGFAGIENLLYLFKGLAEGSWVVTGIIRAIFSVPGHFFFAVLMGYYYSLYHFGVKNGIWHKISILLAPIIAHGIYDGILFSVNVDEGLAVVFMVVFLVFFKMLAKRGHKRIKKLMNK